MKVKIGNMIYDASNEPIMVLLTPKDKENLRNMPEESTKYCAFPSSMDPEDVRKWMNEEPKYVSPWIDAAPGKLKLMPVLPEDDSDSKEGQ